MAKGYERPQYRGGLGGISGGPFAPKGGDTLEKLGDIVSDLYLCTDERERSRLWAGAKRQLGKTQADPQRVEKILAERRIGALSKLLAELKAGGGQAPPTPPPAPSSAAAAPNEPQVVNAQPSDQVADGNSEKVAAIAPTTAAGTTTETINPDTLKKAMKAFRKRLKLTKLDDESRLGNRAMTGGRQSAVVAIMPPREFPAAVWRELSRQGKLRDTGRGFFELIE